MKYFTEPIIITKKQTGKEKLTAGASLNAYLLDPVSVAPNRLRPAVIICPGGGYEHLSDREGEPIAMQFLSMGCHAFVLNYSIAPEEFPYPQMELAASVSLVRSHAEEWLVDPEKIIVCGFSAGGHLACSLGAFWNQEFLYGPLELTPEEIRPDGMILAYPVISSGPYCHQGSFRNLLGADGANEAARRLVSLEHQVGSHTPPVFLWHTSTDDAVPVKNSYLLADALTEHGVSVEMHIYPAGCHGLSLANREVSGEDGRCIVPQCQNWISLAKTWLEHL